ncbi:MAG TPA: glycosyltransferase 87 family protein, partial [Candidatus Obscuribacterales bacterium]
ALASLYWLEQKDIACGLLLSVLSLKPHYLLYLLIPALAKRRWAVVISCLVATAVFAGVSATAFGLKAVIGYPAYVMTLEDDPVYSSWFVCLRCPLTYIAGAHLAFKISIAVYSAAMIWIYRLWRGLAAEQTAIGLAVTVCSMLVVSPHVHFYDLGFLSVPAALLLGGAVCDAGGDWRIKRERLGLITALVAFPIVGAFAFVITDLLPVQSVLALIYLPLIVWIWYCSMALLKRPVDSASGGTAGE